jgi:hypothetical protein
MFSIIVAKGQIIFFFLLALMILMRFFDLQNAKLFHESSTTMAHVRRLFLGYLLVIYFPFTGFMILTNRLTTQDEIYKAQNPFLFISLSVHVALTLLNTFRSLRLRNRKRRTFIESNRLLALDYLALAWILFLTVAYNIWL